MGLIEKLFPRSNPQLTDAPIESVILKHESSFTLLSTPEFEITLPGKWTQKINPERLELVDATETQQLLVSLYRMHPNGALHNARAAVSCVASAIQKTNASNQNMKILSSDTRETNEQVEFRIDGHDPVNQIARASVVRATKEKLLTFAIYQYGQAKTDHQLRAIVQFVFDQIKII